MEAEVVHEFLGKEIGVVYQDSGKDYFLKGRLVKLTSNSLILENIKFGRSVISLDCIKKIREFVSG